MPVRCVIAEAAQERAACHAVAQTVQVEQLCRVEQDFDDCGAGCWVEAHGFLLVDADCEDGCCFRANAQWLLPAGNLREEEKPQGLLRLGFGVIALGQLGPCTLPAVRLEVLTCDRAMRLLFDLDASVRRYGSLPVCHLREVGGGDA